MKKNSRIPYRSYNLFFLLFIIGCSNVNYQKNNDITFKDTSSILIQKKINDSIRVDIQFNNNGNINTVEVYNFKRDIKFFYGFRENGVTPILLCCEKKGNLNGPYFTYYSDGVLNNRVNYKDGKLDGIFENFLENGKLRYRSFYVDGVERNVEYNDTTNMSEIKIEYINE